MYDSPQVETEHLLRLHQREGVLSCSKARYYNPAIGRFVSEDPMRYHVWYNFYAYSANNAVKFRDPSGLRHIPDPVWPPPIPPTPPPPSGIRPNKGCCDPVWIQQNIANIKIQISRIELGQPPSGTEVLGLTAKGAFCDENGNCVPEVVPPQFFDPWMGDEKDPCVRYCVRVHEWIHFMDRRPYNEYWPFDYQTRFSEYPAYLEELKCLLSFL